MTLVCFGVYDKHVDHETRANIGLMAETSE